MRVLRPQLPFGRGDQRAPVSHGRADPVRESQRQPRRDHRDDRARVRAGRACSGRLRQGRACDPRARLRQAKRGARRGLAPRELEELARTAGVEVVDRVLQVRDRVDPRYALGKGKLEDVVIRAMQLDAETLIFDRNLRPAQASNIARMTDLKVVDRTQLILDIFAQHADSSDGKLQVELAQMRYLLPRLGQKDDALSRLTGRHRRARPR